MRFTKKIKVSKISIVLSVMLVLTISFLLNTIEVKADSQMNLSVSGVFNDENGNGYADTGETVTYTYVVTNSGPLTINKIALTDAGVTVTGGAATLAPSDSATFTGTRIITQKDIDTGNFTSSAEVTGTSVTDGEEITSTATYTLYYVNYSGSVEEPTSSGPASITCVSVGGVDFVDNATTRFTALGDEIIENCTVQCDFYGYIEFGSISSLRTLYDYSSPVILKEGDSLSINSSGSVLSTDIRSGYVNTTNVTYTAYYYTDLSAAADDCTVTLPKKSAALPRTPTAETPKDTPASSTTPKTGDNTDYLYILMGLAVLSGMGMLMSIRFMKKSKKMTQK